MSRFGNRRKYLNNNELYESLFEKRKIKEVIQYNTATMRFPTTKEKLRIKTVKHVYKVTDKLYNLAQQHYGDPTLWWIIAWYNGKPTEAHFSSGDLVEIPINVNEALDAIGL